MWFGQKIYPGDGKPIHGKWIAYESRESAIRAGSTLVSILELACTPDAYQQWKQDQEKSGKDPRKMRPSFSFRGPFYADFDDADDLPSLKKRLVKRLDHLQDRHGLEDEDFQLWFTGSKGFHMILDPALFGASDLEHKALPDIYKLFGCHLGLGDLMDPVVYSKGRGRLWRVEGVLRSNGCRKIPISLGQLRGLKISDLKKLAQKSTWYRPELRINPPVINSMAVRFHDAVTLISDREKQKKARRKQNKPFSGRNAKPELADLADALSRLPASYCEDYGEWLMIGMALHDGSEGSMDGLDLWHDWSKQSDKYEPAALDHAWESFESDPDGITVGTLFYLAGKRGR